MVNYDPNILQQHADELYKQAKSVVFGTALSYAIRTAVVVGIIMLVLYNALPVGYDRGDQSNWVVALAVVTIFAVALGIAAGRRKAFQLVLQAQQVLCQRQIELNTRH
jgi:uncharacterized membrane protein